MSDDVTEPQDKRLMALERARAARRRKRQEREAAADAALLQTAPETVEENGLRRRLLADLDPATAALFSDEELAEIDREERAAAKAEAKKQAARDLRAIARLQARADEGLVPAEALRSAEERARLAEPVTFRVNLPTGGGLGLRVDGFLYEHGATYTRPRAVFESIQSNIYLAHLHEIEFSELRQLQRGNSAREMLNRNPPLIEIPNA